MSDEISSFYFHSARMYRTLKKMDRNGREQERKENAMNV